MVRLKRVSLKTKLIAVMVVVGLAVSGYFFKYGSGSDFLWQLGPSPPPDKLVDQEFSVMVIKRSFFPLDSSGAPIVDNQSKNVEREYHHVRVIAPRKTALIVMDPWVDTGSKFLNDKFEPIFRKKLLPLVQESVANGFFVFVLTNAPSGDGRDSLIYPELTAQKEVEILYHQNFNSEYFADFLRKRSIDTLIYTGFASNICVIGREMGMIPMVSKGFRMFFVPDASAAVEFGNSWKSYDAHKNTTMMISQWVGELVYAADLMRAMPKKFNN